MEFWKMHGAGNDFIIVDNRKKVIENKPQTAIEVCDRHFGVGADGLVLVEYSQAYDIKMDFYNSDGSHATMCGNAIRCFVKYVFDNKILDKAAFTVETGDGPKEATVLNTDEKESVVKVNMGRWDFSAPTVIPNITDANGKEYICQQIEVLDKSFELSCVHMGVPHGVILVDEICEEDTIRYGSVLEKHPDFPQGINVNFVKVIDESHIEVDTWERGAGKTLACGTGICSSAIIANFLNKIGKTVEVKAAGGILKVTLNSGSVIMEGKAVTICKGTTVHI
ncbi:MAG: diaminopimelate epimerase [Clostridiales bacterium]|nr:diaminopimelate epimerase [Clostridiales bacterium]